jgi:hypothetical protein
MDMRQLLEQHDRAKQLLLEGESTSGLEEHVAACVICGQLAARLAEIERSIRDVPEPRPELLRRILWSRRVSSEPREPTGRIEMLWPSDPPDGSSTRRGTLLPLVLAVEVDHYPPEATHSSQMERSIIVARYPIVVGRGPDMDVPVWDRSVSRRHAQIDWRGDAWVIRDLESTNGTKVNGARLGNADVIYLTPGDRIEIGLDARIAVRNLLPAVDPAGVVRELRRLLAWAAQPAPTPSRDDRQSEDLRARLVDLRDETVRLRDQLSVIARRGASAEAFPMVYERLANMLALIEQEGLA